MGVVVTSPSALTVKRPQADCAVQTPADKTIFDPEQAAHATSAVAHVLVAGVDAMWFWVTVKRPEPDRPVSTAADEALFHPQHLRYSAFMCIVMTTRFALTAQRPEADRAVIAPTDEPILELEHPCTCCLMRSILTS